MLNQVEENELVYLNISNIFFDHKLDNVEIATLKELLFNKNGLTQVYFKDSIDLNSIEIIKYLLEITPVTDERKIEKYILLNNFDKKELISTSFQTPNSWQIAYDGDDSSYELTTITDYKMIYSHIFKVVDDANKLESNLEKLAFIYNYLKDFEYVNDNNLLPEIFKTNKANTYGFNLVFKKILDELDIHSFIIDVVNDNEKNNALLVKVEDDKYDVNGFYIFDSLSDYLPKRMYEDDLRKINFNYFGLTFKEYSKTIFEDKIVGIASCFMHDPLYDIEKIQSIDFKTKNKFFDEFEMDFDSIHKEVLNTKKISDDDRINIITNSIDINNDLFKQNYYSRKENIFETIKIKEY